MKRVSALLAAVAVALVVAACGEDAASDAGGEFEAAEITVSPGSIRQVVIDAYGEGSSPEVRCVGRRFCNVTYTAEQVVLSSDEQIDGTRAVFAAVFSDPQARQVTVTVRGPVETVGGKELEAQLFQIVCTRRDAAAIDWQRVEPDGLRRLCDFQPMVAGFE